MGPKGGNAPALNFSGVTLGTGHHPRRGVSADLQEARAGTVVVVALAVSAVNSVCSQLRRHGRACNPLLENTLFARPSHSIVRRKVYISFTPLYRPPHSSSKGSAGRSPSQDKTAFLSWMAILDGFHGMPPEHTKKASAL
jgi:hypothetical protein